jgi:hypothetical protein
MHATRCAPLTFNIRLAPPTHPTTVRQRSHPGRARILPARSAVSGKDAHAPRDEQ